MWQDEEDLPPPFFLLPVEILVAIFRYLDGKCLLNVAVTNSYMTDVCKGDSVLRNRIRKSAAIEEMRKEECQFYGKRDKEILRWRISNLLAKYGSDVIVVNEIGPNTIQIDGVPGVKGLDVKDRSNRRNKNEKVYRTYGRARLEPYKKT